MGSSSVSWQSVVNIVDEIRHAERPPDWASSALPAAANNFEGGNAATTGSDLRIRSGFCTAYALRAASVSTTSW